MTTNKNLIKKQTNKTKMLEALTHCLGNISEACKMVNISRETHYRWIREDDFYAQQIEDLQESIIDFVESELFKQIKDGNTTATIFYLKTKGKKRGYIEKTEVDINQNQIDLSDLSTAEIVRLLDENPKDENE